MSVSFSTVIQKAKTAPTHQTTAVLRDALSKLPTTTVSALGNGLRVACEENPAAQFATVGVWLDVGSKYETRDHNRGASKLLELCGLQGTGNLNRQQLSKAIDEIGGHLHCETGVEQSHIYVKCHKDSVPKAVTLLSDIVTNARLADEDIAAAKKDLKLQREAQEEDPIAITMENLRVCAFDATENGGLGNTVMAKETDIEKLDADTLKAYRQQHYTAPRMVLVGAGAVNHTQLEKLASDAFGNLGGGAKPKIDSRFVGGDIKLWNSRTPMVHIAWAFETCGANSGDNTVLNLVKHTFGNFHRSQHELAQHHLYRTMKVYSMLDQGGHGSLTMNQKAIEAANAFHNTYEDTGLCGHFLSTRCAVSDPGHSAETHKEHLHYSFIEMNRLAQRSMTNDELEYAKVNYKSQVLFNNDGSTNTACDIGSQVLSLGRRVSADEMFARIDDVTRNNVMETLQHYYVNRAPVASYNGYLNYTHQYVELQQLPGKWFSTY